MKKLLIGIMALICAFGLVACGGSNASVGGGSGHAHEFTSWQSNETGHWKECACGAKSEVEAHSEGEGGKCACGQVLRTEGLTFTPLGDTAYILSGLGTVPRTVEQVAIPATYNEKPVLYIGESVFAGCDYLNSVLIPEGITHIEQNAFYGCKSLTTITIPQSVQYVRNNSFSYCYNLFEIVNKSPVNITSQYTQQIITDVADSKIVKKDGYIFYVDQTNGSYLLGYTGTETKLTLPTGINDHSYTVNSYSFYKRTALKSLVVPEGVVGIGTEAFSGCTALESVVLSDTVQVVRMSAFYGCTELSSLDLGDGVCYLARAVFRGCSSLTEITIPASVTSMDANVFADCTSLTRAIFEVPTGWKSDMGGGTIGADLSNAEEAANWLKTPFTSNPCFTRSES